MAITSFSRQVRSAWSRTLSGTSRRPKTKLSQYCGPGGNSSVGARSISYPISLWRSFSQVGIVRQRVDGLEEACHHQCADLKVMGVGVGSGAGKVAKPAIIVAARQNP